MLFDTISRKIDEKILIIDGFLEKGKIKKETIGEIEKKKEKFKKIKENFNVEKETDLSFQELQKILEFFLEIISDQKKDSLKKEKINNFFSFVYLQNSLFTE